MSKRQVIIGKFTSEFQLENFANEKAKDGYRVVNVAIDFSRVGSTNYVICMELINPENTR